MSKYPRPGQPTKYKEEFCQELIEHMAEGLSFESFAGRVGVTFQTLYNWEKVHAEFFEAKKLGEAMGLLQAERMGMAGMHDPKNFSTGVYAFWMKNRFRWRDKTPEEIKEEARPLIIVRPSTGEREILTNTRAVEALDVAKSEEEE